MGLFDFLKRKKKTTDVNPKVDKRENVNSNKKSIDNINKTTLQENKTEPDFTASPEYQKAVRSIKASNDFENLLKHAAENPIFRDEFYIKILQTELLVITKEELTENNKQGEVKSANIQLITLNTGAIPVFTSVPKIFEKGIIKENITSIPILGSLLFEMTKGQTLFLNPFSDYGKELLPNEIEGILNGTILSSANTNQANRKETKIQIGTPEVYPNEIVDEMSKLFSSINQVKSAYVAWIHVPISNDPPHYIFAIDVDDDYREIVAQAGKVVDKYAAKYGFADFIRIENQGGGLSDYFIHEAKPFYLK